jgi:hypothetical protein
MGSLPKGISKIGNAYTARIYRNGKAISTTFSFSKYGGEEGALSAAISYMDRITKEIPPTPRKPFLFGLLSNNRTGYNGVTKTRAGNLPCYEVTWAFPPKVKHTKTFTYTEGDDREERDALRQAIAFRKEKEKEIAGSK